MKRSEINAVIRAATAAFRRHGWALPPEPRWDVTDFGLGRFSRIEEDEPATVKLVSD